MCMVLPSKLSRSPFSGLSKCPSTVVTARRTAIGAIPYWPEQITVCRKLRSCDAMHDGLDFRDTLYQDDALAVRFMTLSQSRFLNQSRA